MTRHLNLCRMAAALVLLAGSAAWGQITPTSATHAGQHMPTLAVAVSSPGPNEPDRKDVEDLLMIELANQPFLKLVDRQAIHAVMQEHAITLGNLNDRTSALTLGKLAGADYLLHVLAEKKTAAIRLVEVATGQVKLEEQVALTDDLALSAAAIREKVLTALRPDSQAANRLTVGIAQFPNRSGTGRSDKLGVELQKALRKRLKDEPWAVVLEGQYPTALLEEVDLARLGLARGAPETLPLADLIILGTVQDVSNEYASGGPWEVKLDVTARLRDRNSRINQTCRSDAIEAAADDIVRKVDKFRRQPTSQAAVPEKELWRCQALYLMPQRCETWSQAIVPNFFWSSDLNRRETIRAWENVLLLDDNDPEAMTYLGVCQIGFNRWSRDKVAVDLCIAGSRLVERAVRAHPTQVRADTFISCLGPLKDLAPVRAREMAQYVVDHPGQFSHADNYWVKSALAAPLPGAAGDLNALHAGWNRVIQNSQKDPDSVLLAFSEAAGGEQFPLEQAAAFLAKHLDSSDPVVQFVAHRAVGEALCRQKKDAAGLQHIDKAIDVLEKAYPRCNCGYSFFLSGVYRLRIEACRLLGRPEKAKQTALAGTRHFMKAARFDDAIAWLYCCCVTEVLGEGQEKESLAVCDAYLAAVKKEYWVGRNPWPRVAAKREELLARLAGRSVPDLGGLRLAKDRRVNICRIVAFRSAKAAFFRGAKGDTYFCVGPKGTENTHGDLPLLRMAATGRKMWLVLGGKTGGRAMVYALDRDETRRLPDIMVQYPGVGEAPDILYSVAATKDAVFFGGGGGLHKLDANGKLLRHYDQKNAAMPGVNIQDVCEGGGKIYFAFQGSPHQGVAVLDPASDKISVLAPSNLEAKQEAEPLVNVMRLRWDAATPRLYASCYQYWYFEFPMLTHEYHWSLHDKNWQPYPIHEAPWLVVTQADETLVVRVFGDQSEFHFLKTGQKVTAPVPIPLLMGEPAWDQFHIWAPTASGLYEVDRLTGHISWLAYQDGNSFFSLLKHGSRLYVATARGLYYRDISPMPASEIAPASLSEPHLRPAK